MTLDFIFRLVLYSREDDLSECKGRHYTVLLVNMVQEQTRIETLFKGDNVKALIKTSNCENLVLYFFEKVQKIAVFAIYVFFWVFGYQNNCSKMVLAPPMIRNTHVTRMSKNLTSF